MKAPLPGVVAIALGLLSFYAFAKEEPTDRAPAPPKEHAPPATLRGLKDWINRFKSKDETFVLKAMKDRKIERSTWKFKERDELLLTCTDADGEISFYFFQGKVVNAQIRISAD